MLLNYTRKNNKPVAEQLISKMSSFTNLCLKSFSLMSNENIYLNAGTAE